MEVDRANYLLNEIAAILLENRLTLSIAESCTGGYLAHLCTLRSGASDWFECSLVTYRPSAKNHWLGLTLDPDDDNLDLCRQEVAEQMCRGLQTSKDKVCLATTGVAGTEAHYGHEPGTMWVAVAIGNRIVSRCICLSEPYKDTREGLITRLSEAALDFLLQCLLKREP